MLIGRLLLLLLIGPLCFSCASTTGITEQNESAAWWLSEEFFAQDKEINGTDISQIDPDWKYATVLSHAFLDIHLSKDTTQDIRLSNLKFELTEKLDGAPQKATFIVGLYKMKSGHTGRFIAIFTGTTFIQKFTHSGFSGYSSLYYDGDHIRWYKCIECNDFDELRWSESGYSLQ